MIPPDSPHAPKYWMHETSGVLKPVMEKLLTTESLEPGEIAAVRAYFRQWIMSPAWDANPHESPDSARRLARLRDRVGQITTMDDISKWIAAAVSEGMDPL